MTLNELKKLVAEEYANYKAKINEQGIPNIDVAPGDVDAGGDKDAEKTLKDIFDMLKDYFEGGDDAADDAADDTADDAADDIADLDEETIKKDPKKPKDLKESKQFVARFQKLANIKG
jgi:hypothetical protein